MAGRPKGSKNFNQTQKAIHVYIPEFLYNWIKNKNKSKYIRLLIEKDFNKKNKEKF